MISTMLHSIAVGNMLPARVRTVVVDINPAINAWLLLTGATAWAGDRPNLLVIHTDDGEFQITIKRSR